MRPEQMLNRLLNMFLRRGLNKGMRAGIDHMATGGRSMQDMSPEDRQRAKHMKKQGRQAQRALRTARRFNRF